jgi:long-chain acyl-CoA synthetase
MRTASFFSASTGIEDRTAVRCGDKTRTFADLAERTNRLANALIGLGLKENDRLALLCRNSVEFVETVIAAEKAGLRATVINPMAGRRDMEAALKCCSPRVIVTNIPAALELVEATPDCAVRIYVGQAAGCEQYETVLAAGSSAAVTARSLGVSMPLTSGTTGLPKAVYRKQLNFPPYLRQLLAIAAFDPTSDVAMAPCGLQGSGVYNLAVGLPLKAGVGVIVSDISVTFDLDPEKVLSTIERERVTHLYLPNYIMRQLLSLSEERRSRYHLKSLKCVLHGGSPCPIGLKVALIEWLGPIVTEFYAGAEGGGTLITSPEWMEHRGSVGKPADGLVRVLSDEFAEAQPTETGRVYFRSPKHQRFEYFNNPVATQSVYHEDYFTLGDIGYVDGDGYLYLTGRTAEVIDFSGYTVFPAEIDAVLLDHPSVDACAAVGIVDDEMGEVVGAVVVLREGHDAGEATTEELSQWCRSRLSTSKCPRRWVFCKAIPGFAQGKVNRKSLLPLFEASSTANRVMSRQELVR